MNFSIKTPQFWSKENSIVSWLLWPFSLIYKIISNIRYYLQSPEKISIPVICIGNATVGGSGKTPLSIAIGQLLQNHKYKIAFVCKNYRASIKIPTKVSNKHRASEIIDEALLLSKIAPTYVAKDRLDAIKLAAKDKPDIIIADDGLQNRSFYKDLSILVIDNSLHLKNKFLFPAGPFRESLENGLKKSNVICYINSTDQKEFKPKNNITTQTIFTVPKKKKYIAFTGIAFPEKFFHSLKKLKIEIEKCISFPDHHQYLESDIKMLLSLSKELNIPLITTTKDIIKIPTIYKKHIDILEMKLKIHEEEKLLKIIKEKCALS